MCATRQIDFLNLVVDTIERECGLHGISTDALVDGGIYAAYDPGYNQTQYYDRSSICLWPISFMTKHIDQQTCLSRLDLICDYLQRLKKYPKPAGLVWLDASVSSYPARVARQEDGQYIYTCTVNMQVYY